MIRVKTLHFEFYLQHTYLRFLNKKKIMIKHEYKLIRALKVGSNSLYILACMNNVHSLYAGKNFLFV